MKDFLGRNIYLYDDGTLKALNSSDLIQSGFNIQFKRISTDETNVAFNDVEGFHLNSQSMEWEESSSREGWYNFQQIGNFFTFKSFENKYLTVNSDSILKFDSDIVNQNTMFYINRDCDQGEFKFPNFKNECSMTNIKQSMDTWQLKFKDLMLTKICRKVHQMFYFTLIQSYQIVFGQLKLVNKIGSF